MNAPDRLPFIGRAPYTTPAADMAPLAALLLRNPSTAIPALIAAMDAIKGRDCTQVITDLLDKEAAK